MAHKDTRIGIIGDGGWGTALSLLLADKGFKVSLWGAFPGYIEELKRKKENVKFLPGFKIPSGVVFFSDLNALCGQSDILVLAVPSQYMRSVVKRIDKEHRKKLFLSVAKGVETGTLKVMSQVVEDELGRVNFAVLSGPTIAKEVAMKMPAAVSVASKNKKSAALIREIFSTEYFSLFETDDVLGVELGGSVKNVIAISAGIVEGLGFGSNTSAALFARGVAEMARLGQKMGARRQTFMGLSGLGDLATTCLSRSSRNRSLGEEVGKGRTLKEILGRTEMVVEGVETAKSAYALSRKHKIAMPITEAVHGILFSGHKPKEAVRALMTQKFHRELD